MNLTISKRDLLRVATRMAGIAERKSTMPVLANVLLRTNGTSVSMAATDLYLALDGAMPAAIEKPGTIAVSAKDFVDRIKTLPEGPVALTEKDGGLLIKSVGSTRRFTMRGMCGDDFPPIPKPASDARTLTIDVAVLSSLIALTSFSVSLDETRPHMNSALLEWKGKALRMVSTDGHRLSMATREVDASAEASLLIPLKALKEVKQIADDAYAAQSDTPAQLTIVTSGPHAFFVGGGMTFGVKLVDAIFPPYEQVIPKSSEHHVRAPRVPLLEAIKAVSVASHEKTGGVKLSVSKTKLTLSSASADGGDGEDEVAIEFDGPNMAIGFNARYLVDALGAMTSQEIEIGLGGELDPITLKPSGESASDALFVVMPMRI